MTEDSEILNKWASGWSAGAIRKAFGLSRNRVGIIVAQARQRNDFRAVQHVDQSGQIIGRHRYRPPDWPTKMHQCKVTQTAWNYEKANRAMMEEARRLAELPNWPNPERSEIELDYAEEKTTENR